MGTRTGRRQRPHHRLDPGRRHTPDHNRLTLVPTTNGVRVFGLGRDGQFHTATYTNWTLSPWSPLGGSNFTGTLSAVPMPDGTLQALATNTSGTVHTQHETASGWPRTWTPISGITAAGSPSAVMGPNGTLQIAVRGPNNYVYHTSETNPGNTTFTLWQTITTSETASTNPTALAGPDNTWLVAYLNQNNTPKLRRHSPAAPHGDHPNRQPGVRRDPYHSVAATIRSGARR